MDSTVFCSRLCISIALVYALYHLGEGLRMPERDNLVMKVGNHRLSDFLRMLTTVTPKL